MAEFPLEPQLSKMLLSSSEFGCSNQILTLVAMLSVPYCFYRPKDNQRLADESLAKFAHIDGDHLSFLNAYYAYKSNNDSRDWCNKNFISFRNIKSADDIREQLKQILLRHNIK